MQRISFQSVSKKFRRQESPTLLRSFLVDLLGRRGKRQDASEFWALRDVTFTIRDGESVGILGHNGAGKSTILNIITGAAAHDSGSVEVNGKVAGLLELGSGFHPDLTGRENLRLNAALLGLSKKRIRMVEGDILEFAGITDAIDAQLRTYSSGMMMRLAFSIAIHIDPDILLIDEIVAVGDLDFQNKCSGRIKDFRRQGKTIVFVSHSPVLLNTYCDRALWVDHGRLVREGSLASVLPEYTAAVPSRAAAPPIGGHEPELAAATSGNAKAPGKRH